MPPQTGRWVFKLPCPKGDGRKTLEDLTTRRRMRTRQAATTDLADLTTASRHAYGTAGHAALQLQTALRTLQAPTIATIHPIGHGI